MPNSQANPWGSTGAYGFTSKAAGSKKLNPYYIPRYTQGEGTPTLDEQGRYYWDYGDPNMELFDEAGMQQLMTAGEQTNTTGFVNVGGKKFLRVGDMWEGDANAPRPKLSFDSYGPLTYDEKYGWLANADNVKRAPEDSSFMDDYGLGVVALLAGGVMGLGGAVGGATGGPGAISGGLSAETMAGLGTVNPASIATTLPGFEAGALGAGAAGAGGAGAGLSALGGSGPGAIGMTAADTAGIEGAISAGGTVDGLVSGTQLGSLSQTAGIAAGLPDAGFTWKDGAGWLKTAGSLAGALGNIVNGRYVAQTAANSANNAQLSAEDAKRRADEIAAYGAAESKVMQPWDESGGRKLAGDQLQELLKNPMGVANNDPSYKLRQQAAARAMGIYGMDSGAMGVAAADASSTWYDQRLQQLAGLAGANAAPGAGGQFNLNAMNSSAIIAGQGQASGEFANQARGAARTANLNSGLGILNAVGTGIGKLGDLFGGGSNGPLNTETVGPDALALGAGALTSGLTGGIPLDTGDPTAPGFGSKAPPQESSNMLSGGALANTGRGNFPASGAPDGGGVSMQGNPLWAPTTFSDSSMEPVMRMSSMGNPATGEVEGGGSWQGANPSGFDARGGGKMAPQPSAGGPLQALSGLGGDYRQSPYPAGMGDLLGDYLSPRGRGSMARGMRP